ncbi:MAG: PcfJ domain-containing protein [Alphaproteobacteria bacterium]|nr:PcfJ domain-containing protein [Alphaproteobacteria bacterium]
MAIANFADYNAYLDMLFAKQAVSDIKDYFAALRSSKEQRKAKLASISAEINALLAQIADYKLMIRQSATAADKKQHGQILNSYLTAKSELVKKYNAQKNITLFSQLPYDAKVYACTKPLLLKYLTAAILADNSPHFLADDNGNLIFDAQKLKSSPLARHITHIRDYCRSYIENYPERVKGAKHFTGLHKSARNLEDLAIAIDAYFTLLNTPSEKEANLIKKSHLGIEPFMSFPKLNLQAVKLIDKTSLQYEGSKMHHCVATYASDVATGKTEIYSLRTCADANHEMAPCATIEFKDGTVKQIKGFNDKQIAVPFIAPVRELVMRLHGYTDISEIIANPDIGDKPNIGLMIDTTGICRDILSLDSTNYTFQSMHMNFEALQMLAPYQLKIKQLHLYGGYRNENTLPISSFMISDNAEFYFHDFEFNEQTLDFSWYPSSQLQLSIKSAPNLQNIILPDHIESLSLSGDIGHIRHINWPASLKHLTISGEFIDFSPCFNFSNTRLKEITLTNSVPLNNFHISFDGTTFRTTPTGGQPFFVLEQLSLPDTCHTLELQNFDIKHNHLRLNPSLQSLTGSELICDFAQITPLCNLRKLSLRNFGLTAPELDLPRCFPQLRELELTLGTFYNLKQLILPANMRYVDFSHSNWPDLETLDFSPTQSMAVGYAVNTVLGNLTPTHFPKDRSASRFSKYNPLLHNSFPNSKGRNFGSNLWHMSAPSLKHIIFPPDIKKINLNYCEIPNLQDLCLQNYPHLHTLEMAAGRCSDACITSIGNASSVKRLSILVDNRLPLLPASLEELVLAPQSAYTGSKVAHFNFSAYPALKSVQGIGGLFIDPDCLPSTIRQTTLSCTGQTLDGLKSLNLKRFDKVNISTSSYTCFPDLERLAMPREYDFLLLWNLCPKLTEIDLTAVAPDHPITFYTFGSGGVSSDEHAIEGGIMLEKGQLTTLRKIKLGSNLNLIFTPDVLTGSADLTTADNSEPALPPKLVFELSADISPAAKRDFIARHPSWNITQAAPITPQLNRASRT